jgi:hypothetical protein
LPVISYGVLSFVVIPTGAEGSTEIAREAAPHSMLIIKILIIYICFVINLNLAVSADTKTCGTPRDFRLLAVLPFACWQTLIALYPIFSKLQACFSNISKLFSPVL